MVRFALLSLPLLLLSAGVPVSEGNHGSLAIYRSYETCWTFTADWVTGYGDAQAWEVRLHDSCYGVSHARCHAVGSLEIGLRGACLDALFETCGIGHHHALGVGHHRDDFVCMTWDGETRWGSVESFD